MKDINKLIVMGAGEELRRAAEVYPVMLEEIVGCVEDILDACPPPVDILADKIRVGINALKDQAYDKVILADSNFYSEHMEKCLEAGVSPWRIMGLRQYILDLAVRGRILPRKVILDVCSACQLDCAACYMRRNADEVAIGLGYCSAGNFRKFLEDNPHIESVEISNNGEAFLNPELADILRCAAEKKVTITVGNGSNFNTVSDEVLELLVKTKVQVLTVSLDGASQEIYAKYRRKGNFEQVVGNIRKLNMWKEKYKSKFPRLVWQYVIMEHTQNVAEITKAKEMAVELGMDISFKLTWEKGFVAREPKRLEELTGLKVFSREDYKKKSNKKELYLAGTCWQPFNTPAINWDGRLLGCCTVYQRTYPVNVFEVGLQKALSDEMYVRDKRRLLGERIETEEDSPCLACYRYRDMKESCHFLQKEKVLAEYVDRASNVHGGRTTANQNGQSMMRQN